MEKADKKLSKKESKAIELRQKIQKAAFLGKLEEAHLIQIACQKAGIGRSTYYRWLEEDEDFAEKARIAQFHGKEIVDDLAESKIITAIKDGNLRAAELWLKHSKDKYRFKPETLKKFQDNVEEEREHRSMKIMMREVFKQMGNIKFPWQTNSKTGMWDDRKKVDRSPNEK